MSKLNPFNNGKLHNYVSDTEWVMQSPKSGIYIHIQLDRTHGKAVRKIMAEINETLNAIWEATNE